MSKRIIYSTTCRKEYTFWSFLFDIFMILITGGLWIIWMIIRGMR